MLTCPSDGPCIGEQVCQESRSTLGQNPDEFRRDALEKLMLLDTREAVPSQVAPSISRTQEGYIN